MQRGFVRAMAMRFVLLFVLVIVALCALAFLFLGSSSSHEFERLLSDAGKVEIMSMKITGQGREVMLNDPVAAKYLTESFQQASKEGFVPKHEGGYTYYAYIVLSNGDSVMVGCWTPDGTDGLTIAYPYDSLGDPTYYWIPFAEPMPRAVSAALGQMRDPPVAK